MMTVETILEDDRWETVGLPKLAETAACATLSHLGLDPDAFEIAVLAADDARIADLNAQFRERDAPTNVLSWPAEDLSADTPGGTPTPPQAMELGDIALAWETCAREAADADKPLDAHLRHLVVHAVLHLLGYDHIHDRDAEVMEGLEQEILGNLGDPSPY